MNAINKFSWKINPLFPLKSSGAHFGCWKAEQSSEKGGEEFSRDLNNFLFLVLWLTATSCCFYVSFSPLALGTLESSAGAQMFPLASQSCPCFRDWWYSGHGSSFYLYFFKPFISLLFKHTKSRLLLKILKLGMCNPECLWIHKGFETAFLHIFFPKGPGEWKCPGWTLTERQPLWKMFGAVYRSSPSLQFNKSAVLWKDRFPAGMKMGGWFLRASLVKIVLFQIHPHTLLQPQAGNIKHR